MSDYTNTPIGSGYNANSAINTELSAVETAVNSKLDKSGSTMTGELDMNSKKIINLPDATTLQEPVTYGQMINGASFAASDAKYFDTVALATADTTLKVGDVVIIEERANGIFNVVTVGTTANVDLPNTYNIIVSTVDATKCFVLRAERVLIPAQWGAFADGDPVGLTANGTDNGAPLQAMIEYLNDIYNEGDFTGGGDVLLDAGTYETTTGLTLYPNINITGRGMDVSEIQNQFGNTSSYTMINLPDNGVSGSERINRNISLTGFSVNGNDNNTTGVVKNCVFDNAIYCTFDRMEFKQSEGDNLTFKDCSNMQFGVMLVRDGNNSQVVLDGLTNTTFGSGVIIRTGSDWGVLFDAAASISTRVSFTGVKFASSAKGGIRCDNSSTNISVKACDFIEGGGNTFGADSCAIRVTTQDADGWKIKNNDLTRIFGKGIHVENDNVVIKGNTINSCRYSGIVAEGNDSIVTDNEVFDAGYDTDATYDGINISGIRSEVQGNSIKFVNDVGGAGQKLLNGIVMDTGSNNGRCHNNTVGSNASTNSLVINESSVVSYKNKGAVAQLAFVIATMSGDQVIASSSTTTVDFDTEGKDVQGDYDTTTQTFTSPADGYYKINCTVDTESVNASTTQILVQADNVTDGGISSLFNIQDGAFVGTIPLQGKVFLNEGDEFRIRVQFAGGDGTVNDRSYLQIERADI